MSEVIQRKGQQKNRRFIRSIQGHVYLGEQPLVVSSCARAPRAAKCAHLEKGNCRVASAIFSEPVQCGPRSTTVFSDYRGENDY